ncbi:MAG TPA: ATP-binding cassette domain-containing protein, partial [Terriglobia bacterium]|nr:ATP-binding cassette domain-containing protein [Terriglobia bacterium]
MPSDTLRGKPALELRDVSKQFGDFQALNGVCLRVESRDSILLYGPNGAGKTTLLRVLSTLARP